MIGENLGSFRIEAILGTGAMGVVYKAVSETTGRPAAVKVISGEANPRGKTYERFRREAEILQQFRHPNIVRFLALGRYQGTSYFAMEYVAGETLEQMLRDQGALPWNEVVDLGIQICEALHYAHEHGVVHRDLKPSNLMISQKGQIKLTDFGIAKDLDATALTATGRTLGTAAYMAPEQIRGTPEISHKTDLYALGVVLYQMLTGRPAFEGTSAVVLMHCHLNQPAPRPSAKLSEIPVALDKLIVQLMAKDPADRPWDAAAVAVSLTEIRDKATRGETVAMVWPGGAVPSGETVAAGLETTKASPSKKKKAKARSSFFEVPDRSTVELILLLVGLVSIGGFLGYMLWPPSQEYLFRQAEILMEREKLHDWITAREKYLDPLDHRFQTNPYRKTTRAWRDRIALTEAGSRAEILEGHLTRLNKPNGRAEEMYRAYFELADKSSRENDDLAAVHYWQELAEKLESDPEERGWMLLAQKRAADLTRAIQQRGQLVREMLASAAKADQTNHPLEAARIRQTVLEKYKKYTDMVPVFEEAGLSLNPPDSQVPGREPAPKPEPSGTTPGPETKSSTGTTPRD